MKCAFCNKVLDINEAVIRSDTCPNCGRDLHCCIQCKFFDPSSYNECKEVSAERVVDKGKANFCEYFLFKGERKVRSNKQAKAKKALEDLFKRK